MNKDLKEYINIGLPSYNILDLPISTMTLTCANDTSKTIKLEREIRKEAINIITNGTKQVAEYPISIYKKPVRLFFTIIIPVVLINYYPISYLTDQTTSILYVFMPMSTIILFLISQFLFHLGMKKYCSTGS